jgi:hypothetical protein
MLGMTDHVSELARAIDTALAVADAAADDIVGRYRASAGDDAEIHALLGRIADAAGVLGGLERALTEVDAELVRAGG